MSRSKVLILGGGYAGLSCALDLAAGEDNPFEIHLVDGRPDYLNLVHLHKSIHTPLDNFRIPFARLADEKGFTFHERPIAFDEQKLNQWSEARKLDDLDFDYLVVATGSAAYPLEKNAPAELLGRRVVGLEGLKHTGAREIMAAFKEEAAGATDDAPAGLTVVGGGPTGIQFLFELDDFLKLRKLKYRLRLVNMEEKLLGGFPRGFNDYVVKRMKERGIEYFPRTKYIAQTLDRVELERDGETLNEASLLTLLFPGVAGAPLALENDAHGRVRLEGRILENVFAAGDCTRFDGRGLNALSAQAAVRKGRLVAKNIMQAFNGKRLERYSHQELGYFLSLGYWDGIGWMLVRFNVLTGLPAFAIKEAIEAQFNLLLRGIDTYVI